MPKHLPVSPKPARDRSVFINCPFDAEYKPLLRAACFTILTCGYVPRCALDYNDSGEIRLTEIIKMIARSDLSIRDISRVEVDKGSGLPRFNMPLELGADLGLRLQGPARQRQRKTLILDTVMHRYDKVLSDISGMDIEAHGNNVTQIARRVRDWLNANRMPGSVILPGAAAIDGDHQAYLRIAPDIVKSLRLNPHDDLPHGDYLDVVKIALPRIEAARAATEGSKSVRLATPNPSRRSHALNRPPTS
ncbi:MAG: hypothetical protein QOF90_3191 [Acetobacteraceae bacterium]|jgi:hypothetical protein|nr:hypothetical protein [Acetobacteraceae bacterium]MEA2777785.1 hypothetical protein [Acetobacteraceae bacterium]